jgi:hypothetical protein
MLTIVVGILIALIGVARLVRSGSPRTMRIGAVLGALMLGVLAYVDITSISERIKLVEENSAVGSVGMGIILIAIAAALALVGGLLAPPKAAVK